MPAGSYLSMDRNESSTDYFRYANHVIRFWLFRPIDFSLAVHRWDVEIASTRAVVEKINRMEPKPRFFIICGDIVDALPRKTMLLDDSHKLSFVEQMKTPSDRNKNPISNKS